jgi:hypothetical protein|nr:MAG TPA: helix-turn-helix domain protein [Bacteriophage sp.]
MEQPNYYAVIPANVRYDSGLTPNAKLLYGEISALAQKDGVCYATNKYFAELYNVSQVSISKWINSLVYKKYINFKIIYKEGTKEILNRYLTLVYDPIKENLKDNNTSNNIKEINNNKLLFTKKKFIKPTLEEVRQYCLERKNKIDAEKFIDYYESNGWKVGRNSMKDWKAAIRTWESNAKEKQTNAKSYQERRIAQQEKAGEEFLRGN